MAQIAEIIVAILGLCNVLSVKTICIVVIACEALRLTVDIILKIINNN